MFVNKPNLSFDNCGKKATETVSLTAEQATGEDKIELDFTQFQNVRVISIFVDDNQGGGDVTNVSKIIVNGHPVHPRTCPSSRSAEARKAPRRTQQTPRSRRQRT